MKVKKYRFIQCVSLFEIGFFTRGIFFFRYIQAVVHINAFSFFSEYLVFLLQNINQELKDRKTEIMESEQQKDKK